MKKVYMNPESFDFVKNYPQKWYTGRSEIPDRLAFYNVCYTYPYRKMIEKYNVSDKNKSLMQEHVLDKLKNEILVDLGSGGSGFNVAVVAYLANAKAYMGIDVNANLSTW